jgi:hypothetical protein
MANPGLIKSLIAEAAILSNRVVKFGTADGLVIQSAAASDAHIGIAELGQETAGQRVDVVLDGTAEVTVGAAVARGAQLMVDASGRVITAAAAAGTNVRTIGTAMAAAASANEIIPVAIARGTFQG